MPDTSSSGLAEARPASFEVESLLSDLRKSDQWHQAVSYERGYVAALTALLDASVPGNTLSEEVRIQIAAVAEVLAKRPFACKFCAALLGEQVRCVRDTCEACDKRYGEDAR